MGIARHNGVYGLPEGQECFYCGHTIRDVGIMWMGVGGEVYLHPPCVVELTIRLFRDVHEYECNVTYVTQRVEESSGGRDDQPSG